MTVQFQQFGCCIKLLHGVALLELLDIKVESQLHIEEVLYKYTLTLDPANTHEVSGLQALV